MQDKSRIILLVGGLVILIGLAAGVFVFSRGGPEPTKAVVLEQPQQATNTPPATAAAEEESGEDAQPADTQEPTESAPPTPKQGLASTDPSTVNLASGSVQLIEVFAFW